MPGSPSSRSTTDSTARRVICSGCWATVVRLVWLRRAGRVVVAADRDLTRHAAPAQQRVQDADRAAVVVGEHRGNVLRAAEQVTCGAHAGLPGVLALGYCAVSAGSWAGRWRPASR